jgi:hypothetical protein
MGKQSVILLALFWFVLPAGFSGVQDRSDPSLRDSYICCMNLCQEMFLYVKASRQSSIFDGAAFALIENCEREDLMK